MTMKRWEGSSQIDLTTDERWDGTSWITLTLAKRWDGAAWVDIPLPGGGGGVLTITADVNPATTDFIFDDGSYATFCESNLVTTTTTGGTGPYTYSWTRLSGSSAVACDSPTSSSTKFSCTIYRGSTRSAVYRCTVTDSAAATAYVDISVILSR